MANYNALVDKRARITFSANQQTGNPQIEMKMIPNTKIASNRIDEAREEKRRKKSKNIEGQMMSLTEMIGYILNQQTVFCSESFVSVATNALENRPGTMKEPKRSIPHDDEGMQSEIHQYVQEGGQQPLHEGFAHATSIDSIQGRKNLHLEQWRNFTNSQEMILRDQLYAEVSVDTITYYGIRPPELLCLCRPEHYLQWFHFRRVYRSTAVVINGIRVHKSVTEQLVQNNLFNSSWIDGLERKVYIRKVSIKDVIDEYHNLMNASMLLLLNCIYYKVHAMQYDENDDRMNELVRTQLECGFDEKLFVHKQDESKRNPIVVYRNTKPTRTNKFLQSLPLSMGKFSNEVELWDAKSIVEVFYNAKLIPVHPSIREPSHDEIDTILKEYIDKHLLYIPCSTKTFDRYVIVASQTLYNALKVPLSGSVACENVLDTGILPYLYTTLFQSNEEKCKKYILDMKKTLVEKLVFHVPNAPTIDQLLNASKEHPIDWLPNFDGIQDQSDQSKYEQYMAFQLMKKKVDAYCNGQMLLKPGTIISGFAGSGKTFLEYEIILYMICKGLCIISTTRANRRARENGGCHWARWLRLPRSHNECHPTYSDNTIARLYSSAEKLNFLRHIDAVVDDEGQTESAEFLSSLDATFRYIRQHPSWLGGALYFSTIALDQIGNIHGKPLLTSPNIITAFDVIDLVSFVRSRNDSVQQQLMKLIQQYPMSLEIEQKIKHIIIHNYSHVSSWNDPAITQDMLPVFSKKVAVAKAEKRYIEAYVQSHHIPIVTRKAEDEQSLRSSVYNWTNAMRQTTSILNTRTKLPEELSIYQNAIVEMTFNRPNYWSQGQVAIIRSSVTQYNVNHWKPITVFIGPIQDTMPPTNYMNLSDEMLEVLGWKKYNVKPIKCQTETITKEMLGRRYQYPLRSRNAITFHKLMGDTIEKGITQISSDPKSMYYCWDRGIANVGLTRCPQSKNWYFVNPKGSEATANDIINILKKRTQFYEYTRMILQNLAQRFILHNDDEGMQDVVTEHSYNLPDIQMTEFPYQLHAQTLPNASATPTGFLYLLLSLRDRNTTYIGQTTNLKRRLLLHNEGIHKNTADWTYRPWVIVVFFTGFKNDMERRQLEQVWFRYRDQAKINQGCISVMEIINLGIQLCTNYNECSGDRHIVLFRCYVED